VVIASARCPACDSPQHRALPPVGTRYTGGQVLGYVFCDRCGLVFGAWTGGDTEAEGHGLTSLRTITREEFLRDTAGKAVVNRHRVEWLDDVLRRHAGPARGRALEIGGKDGSFGTLLRERGWGIVGVDPDAAFAEWAQRIHGVEMLAHRFSSELFSGQRFDLVVAIQLIEHVARPLDFLRDVRRVVGERGVLYLETPDLASIQQRQLHTRHVTLYSAGALCQVLRQAGFEPIEVGHGGPGGLLTFDQLAVVARAAAVPAAPTWTREADYASACVALERALASDWPYGGGGRSLGTRLRRRLRRGAGAVRQLLGGGDGDLQRLPDEIRESVRHGSFGREQARVLLGLEDGLAQRRLWKRAVFEDWSPARLAQMARTLDDAAMPREGQR
jgi:SAM-dependent methyltransferase